MKTKVHYKTLLVLMFMPFFVLSVNKDWKGRYTEEKTIKKEFSVNKDATVKIVNSYGNLDIVTWNENRVVMEITITTNGNDEDKVKKKLEQITVDFEANSSLVFAKTRFNNKKSSSWWNWGNNNNVNMKINYVVKMPITNDVDFSNDYGSINLDTLEGDAKINCDYGKITTKELMSDNNLLNFDYTNNSFFEYIKRGKINADYSGYTVSKAEDLQIVADYTKSVVEVAENVTYNCDYGSITIEKVNNVNGNGDYLTTRIGDVYKDVTIEADYGSIKIERLTANAGNVKINSDYVGIKIGIDSNYNFNFEFDLEYGSLKGLNSFEYNKKRVESSDRYYLGYHGTPDSGNKIWISSDYGSLSFYEN